MAADTGSTGRIYLSPPDVGAEERRLLLEAFDSNWISTVGAHVDAFEAELAALAQRAGGAAVSSGTAALHLALRLLGVGPGDEVLVPTLTFIASAAAVTYVGASPVFIDVDPATWTIDVDMVETELSARARGGTLPAAVVSVDLFGQCADYEPLLDACARYDVPVVSDAAESLGATYQGRPAGSFGHIGVFSFNGNKIITTSGGGMLVADDPGLTARARKLASHAREPVVHYEHLEIGYNYRLSNLLAAVGRAQLRGLPERLARRRAINACYREALHDLPGVGFMPRASYGCPNHWLTVITIDPRQTPVTPSDVQTLLEARDIEARPVWKPLHMQEAFRGCDARGGTVSSDIFASGLCLPSGSGLTSTDQERVIGAITDAWASNAAHRTA